MVVLKTLDKMPASKIKWHYPFTIHHLHLEKFLRKVRYNVVGWIDIFALLRSI